MSSRMSKSEYVEPAATPPGTQAGPSAGTPSGTPAPSADPPAPAVRPKAPKEIGGPPGPEPTRYGDWQFKGRVTDF